MMLIRYIVLYIMQRDIFHRFLGHVLFCLVGTYMASEAYDMLVIPVLHD